jgi:hypothetical protein
MCARLSFAYVYDYASKWRHKKGDRRGQKKKESEKKERTKGQGQRERAKAIRKYPKEHFFFSAKSFCA